jgi:hypothetical protein
LDYPAEFDRRIGQYLACLPELPDYPEDDPPLALREAQRLAGSLARAFVGSSLAEGCCSGAERTGHLRSALVGSAAQPHEQEIDSAPAFRASP